LSLALLLRSKSLKHQQQPLAYFVMGYLLDLYVLATSLVSIASVVCNYTDTPKDDAFVSKAYKLLEQFAFLGNKAKQ